MQYGNSVLEGGPEDGQLVQVAWPPFPLMNRRVGNVIVTYRLLDDLADGRMRWRAVEETPVADGS